MATITTSPERTEDTRGERVGAAGGIAFVAIGLVANFLPGAPPATDAPAAKVAAYFTGHAGNIKAAQFFSGFALVGLLWWFGSLWRTMDRAEGRQPQLAAAAAVSFAIGVGLAMLSGALTATAAIRSGDAEGVQLLWTLANVVLSTASVALAVFVGAVSVLNYRTRALPVWTSHLGSLAAVAFLVGSAGVATTSSAVNVFNLVAFLLWCGWIVAVSTLVWRRATATAPTP